MSTNGLRSFCPVTTVLLTAIISVCLILASCTPAPTATPPASSERSTPKPSGYNESPMLAELVKASKLLLVDQRLPRNPMLIQTEERVDEYGVWRMAMLKFEPLTTSPVAPDFKFTHLSAKEGLSQNDVRSVVQDRQGFMWFGTMQGGLNRYDGHEFKVYRHDADDSQSLSANFVTALHVDQRGTLWVGTQGGGLNRYDRDSDSFVHYTTNSSDPRSLPDNITEVIYEDRAGEMWVGTHRGLARFDPDRGTFHTYKHDPANPDSIGDDFVMNVLEDRETGLLWISTHTSGVSLLDRATGRFTHYRHDPADPTSLSSAQVTQVFQDRAGNLWIATRGGLDRFDRTSQSFVRYVHDPNNPHSLGDNYVTAVYEDRVGRFWIATIKGLDLLDHNTGTFMHYRPDSNDPNSLSYEFAWRIYEDNTGAIWVTTLGGGVNRLPSEPDKFVTYRHDPTNPHSLADTNVETLYVDQAGTLWVGTPLGGIHSFDGQTMLRHPEDPNNPDKRNMAYPIAMTIDENGALWTATYSTGLWRFDGQRFINYRHDPDDPASIAANDINSLLPDEHGGLWMGIHYNTGGLDYFDGRQFTHYPGQPGATTPGVLPVMCPYLQFRDKNGLLWMSSDDHGIVRFDPKTKTSVNYLVNPDNPADPANTLLYSIYPASDKVYWVGGVTGLYRFEPTQGKFTRHYTSKDGLPSDVVMAINSDDQGRLWLSTLAGISRFDPKTGQFRNYDKSDGMAGDQFNRLTTAKGRDGQLFFGSEEGLVAFHPNQMQDNPHAPPVVLTSFALFDKPVAVGAKDSPLKQAINVADQVTLRHDQSVLSLRFAALNYTAPQKNRYAYKLEGFDSDWRYTDAVNRLATYTNLDPGDYVFRVKASNNDGVWNEQGTSLKITITPPWWETWWFRAGAAVVLLALAFSGYRLRVRRIEQRSQEFERQVTDRTRQLAETNQQLQIAKEGAEQAQRLAEAASQAKSVFLANMSHELRSPLNAILGFSRLIAREPALPAPVQENVGIITRSGEHLYTLINQVLDLSKIEAGQAALNPTNLDLHRLLDDVEEMFFLRAADKGLQLCVDVGQAPQYVRADEVKLRQVLINLLNNAVKFTSRGSVTLRVITKDEGGRRKDEKSPPDLHPSSFILLTFQISDTGPGIAPHELEHLFEAFVQAEAGRRASEGTGLGLAISRSFVQLMGGELHVASQVGQGTTISFDLPVTLAEASQTPAPSAAARRRVIGLEPGQPRYRVLVVDDRWSARQLLARLLGPLGFEVREAGNGQEAIENCAVWTPHLICMDLRMPVMDGREAARRIKATPQGQAIPIIALTASSFDEERAVILASGFDEFLRKPFHEADLFELIHKHLGARFVYEQPAAATPAAATAAEALPAVAALAALPPERVTALKVALTELDPDAIARAIDDLRPHDTGLADRLWAWARHFQYGQLLRLIEDAHAATHEDE